MGYYGSLLRKQALGDLEITETEYAPLMRIPPHEHQSAYVSFVVRGAYVERCGNARRDCRTWTVLFHPSGETHSNHFAREGGRCLNVQFGSAWRHRIETIGRNEPLAHEALLSRIAAEAYGEFRQPDEYSTVIVEGLMLELLGVLGRASHPVDARMPRWLLDAREMLRKTRGGPYSLTTLAREIGVHPVHLARSFRKHFGTSPGEFVRRARVVRACLELTSENTPLVEIALRNGFASQSHFSTIFKRYAGMTPATYRKMRRS
jgi:AraC family transcriptional regulator